MANQSLKLTIIVAVLILNALNLGHGLRKICKYARCNGRQRSARKIARRFNKVRKCQFGSDSKGVPGSSLLNQLYKFYGNGREKGLQKFSLLNHQFWCMMIAFNDFSSAIDTLPCILSRQVLWSWLFFPFFPCLLFMSKRFGSLYETLYVALEYGENTRVFMPLFSFLYSCLLDVLLQIPILTVLKTLLFFCSTTEENVQFKF